MSCLINSRDQSIFLKLICIQDIIKCVFTLVIHQRLRSGLALNTMSFWWCHLAWLMLLLPSWIWWIGYSNHNWINLWWFLLTIFWCIHKAEQSMNAIWELCWTHWGTNNFMPLKYFNLEIKYHPGKANVMVVALSRKAVQVAALMIREQRLNEIFRNLNSSN